MKKRSFMVLLLAVLMLSSIFVGSVPVFAAADPDHKQLTITPQTTSSFDKQVYVITNNNNYPCTVNYISEISTAFPQATVGREVPANGSITVTIDRTCGLGENARANYTYNAGAYGENKNTLPVGVCKVYSFKVRYELESGTRVKDPDTKIVTKGSSTAVTAPKEIAGVDHKMVLVNQNAASFNKTFVAGDVVFKYVREDFKNYNIGVKYVDQSNNEIFNNSLLVTPTAPASFSVPNTYTNHQTGYKYELVSGGAGSYTHEYKQGEKTYTFHYKLVVEEQKMPYAVTVQYKHGNTLLARAKSYTIQPDGSLDIPTDAKVYDFYGNAYTRNSGEKTVINHQYADGQKNYIIQYSPAGPPVTDYKITIYCREASSGEYLDTIEVNVPKNGIGEYTLPGSITKGGVIYSYSIGQDSSRTVRHPFADGEKTYTFYYDSGEGLTPKSFTLNLRDAETGAAIRTMQGTAMVGDDKLLSAYGVPSSFTADDGTEYVIMRGQMDQTISYFTLRDHGNYYVLYRNAATPEEEVVVTPTLPQDETSIVNPDENELPPEEQGNGDDEPTPSPDVVDPEDDKKTPEEEAFRTTMLWIVLLLAILAGGTTLVILGRRKKKAEATEEKSE
ncbi:hypothetical protein LJC20_00835 [Eubacteriales bacterium OttesenSCG-928-M02]|nr:hypothetical protein [Eubacteriales bacterium OttesenSCG-928-M02]